MEILREITLRDARHRPQPFSHYFRHTLPLAKVPRHKAPQSITLPGPSHVYSRGRRFFGLVPSWQKLGWESAGGLFPLELCSGAAAPLAAAEGLRPGRLGGEAPLAEPSKQRHAKL